MLREIPRRVAVDGAVYLFALNHGESDATVPGSGVDLLDGSRFSDMITVPAGSVRAIVLT